MHSLKRHIKNFFVITNTLSILDRLNYVAARLKNLRKNKVFKRINPGFSLPPDYYLYETYQLDYKQYKEDGEITASEIIAWTKKYLPDPLRVLEWGCGVARVIRHIPNYLSRDSKVYGVDINKEMINWNKAHIKNVRFSINDYNAPAKLNDNYFDLVFALSVFTHIEHPSQSNWVEGNA